MNGNPAEKNSIDQHQNTTNTGLASDQRMLCFGAGLCCLVFFFQQGTVKYPIVDLNLDNQRSP